MTTPSAPEENRPWWRERMVWLIIALPTSAVVAGIATVFIAAHDPDDMVISEYTKTGLAVDVQESTLRQAAEMGVTGALKYQDAGVLTLTLADSASYPAQLELTLVHPTQANLDQKILLAHQGQGLYQAHIQLSGQGKRRLILTPPTRDWQLQGSWHAPFNEETSLSATGAINPTSHP